MPIEQATTVGLIIQVYFFSSTLADSLVPILQTVLRSIAEAKIPWSFSAPPLVVEDDDLSTKDHSAGMSTATFTVDPAGNNGIWLGVREDDAEGEEEEESSEEDELGEESEEEEDSEDSEGEESSEDEVGVQQPVKKGGGFKSMFEALGVEEGESEEESSDSE